MRCKRLVGEAAAARAARSIAQRAAMGEASSGPFSRVDADLPTTTRFCRRSGVRRRGPVKATCGELVPHTPRKRGRAKPKLVRAGGRGSESGYSAMIL